jgi:hypothetical protein
MSEFPPVTRTFLAAVRRRMMLVQLAESLAIGLAVASVVGVIFVLLLWARGENAGNSIAVILALGAFFGAIWGIARRPTRLQAALEADGQLNLQDLLGTVLLIAKSPGDSPWRDAVYATAENRCGQLRPSQLVIRKLGLREWGGVGLSTALLLTLGLLTARPANLQAAGESAESAQFARAGDLLPTDSQTHSMIADFSSTIQPISRPPGPGGQDEQSNRNDDNNNSLNSDSDDSKGASAAGDDHSGPIDDRGGAGGGMAITHPLDHADLLDQAESSGSDDASADGQTGGGNGAADSQPSRTGPASSSGNVQRNPHPANSGNDADSSSAADGAPSKADGKSSGDEDRVPDWASDLVKDYFQH